MKAMLLLLLVFYTGAVLASAHAWHAAWRGKIRYSGLRDLTGIGDPVALRRLFGLTTPGGLYEVSLAEVVLRRRKSGMILTNLPAHGMFLAALAWAALHSEGATAAAIAFAGGAHAAMLAAAAASILLGGRQALTD